MTQLFLPSHNTNLIMQNQQRVQEEPEAQMKTLSYMYIRRTWDDACLPNVQPTLYKYQSVHSLSLLAKFSLNSLQIHQNSLKTQKNSNKIDVHNKYSQLMSETQLSAIKAICLFLFIIQPKQICERNMTCTNNASSSLSSLSQIIITILYSLLPSSLLSYIFLLSLYLGQKPGPRCKGDSTL